VSENSWLWLLQTIPGHRKVPRREECSDLDEKSLTTFCHCDGRAKGIDREYQDKLPGPGELHTLVFMPFLSQFLLTVNDDVLVIFLIPTNYQVSFILSCLVFMSL